MRTSPWWYCRIGALDKMKVWENVFLNISIEWRFFSVTNRRFVLLKVKPRCFYVRKFGSCVSSTTWFRKIYSSNIAFAHCKIVESFHSLCSICMFLIFCWFILFIICNETIWVCVCVCFFVCMSSCTPLRCYYSPTHKVSSAKRNMRAVFLYKIFRCATPISVSPVLIIPYWK